MRGHACKYVSMKFWCPQNYPPAATAVPAVCYCRCHLYSRILQPKFLPNGHAATPRHRPRDNDFPYSRALLLRSYGTPLSTPSRQSTKSNAFPIRRFGVPAAKFAVSPASSCFSSSSAAFREVGLHHVAHAADAGDEGPDRQGQPGQVQEGSQDHQLRQGGASSTPSPWWTPSISGR